MNFRLTLRILGGLLIFLGIMLLTPVPFSFVFPSQGRWHDGALWSFLLSSAASLAIGFVIYRTCQSDDNISHREGFAVVTLGWIVFATFGSLPYVFSGCIPSVGSEQGSPTSEEISDSETEGIRFSNPINAFFEAMSGFTTTGSTVIPELGKVPRSILFWRSMTQWLGGMGIIVLSLAILPFLKVGGMQLFEAEAPGPTSDRLSPRIQDTAKVLWGVYFFITVAEMILLSMGDMDWFQAICHSLTTMATGGFSTEDASIGAFSTYSHNIVTFFMFLAGANFALHYFALRGKPQRYWHNEEFRVYAGIALFAIAALTILNFSFGPPGIVFRDAAFQTLSILTTTGFGSPDYEQWPAASQYLVITLMFVGGCAGSTAGGMKVVRLLLVFKHANLQLGHLIHPRGVRILRLDHLPVSREVIQSILGFFALFIGIFLIASIAMSLLLPPATILKPNGDLVTGPDVITAGGSVIACLGNIGPGLGEVGPTDNFASVPALGKLILSLCMLVGRLEVFTVLVLFFPSFWRK